MDEYPKMIFRKGDMLPDHNVDILIVENEGEEREALENGWRLGLDPLDHDGDGWAAARQSAPDDSALSVNEHVGEHKIRTGPCARTRRMGQACIVCLRS